MSRVRIAFPDEVLFVHELPVRVSDLNYGNHLGHDSLVSLLHEARTRFLAAGDMSELDAGGAGVILCDLAVSYRSEAFLGQTLRVEIGAEAPTRKGVTLLYRVTDAADGRVVALAATGLLFFDYGARKVVPMPDRFRARLRRA